MEWKYIIAFNSKKVAYIILLNLIIINVYYLFVRYQQYILFQYAIFTEIERQN